MICDTLTEIPAALVYAIPRGYRQLDKLAQARFGKRVIHLALRWILDQGVTSALWGARSPDQHPPRVAREVHRRVRNRKFGTGLLWASFVSRRGFRAGASVDAYTKV